ncbi:MAG: hypothetical protein K9L70_04895 [Thiohalocapsa sp.]|nr:hypothetical protein [Thiohalocapsa sp.]MCF7991994.1 hypothetical protein [Thiohalocapsa sp.]
MDSFTRNYSIVLALIVLVLLAWWASSVWQPRVWELNEMLEADPQLSDYPYQFRVVDVEQGTATLSTPRSFKVPAMRFLEIIEPGVAGKAQDDPAMLAAQQDLIDHQKRAQGLVLAQPDVERVDWELDVKWLAAHGVHAPVGGQPGQ